jgi:hypothetical protein
MRNQIRDFSMTTNFLESSEGMMNSIERGSRRCRRRRRRPRVVGVLAW